MTTQCVFLTFPRCGSNFIIKALYSSSDNGEFIKNTHSMKEALSYINSKETQLFSIVRNPYDSIISLAASDTLVSKRFIPDFITDNFIKYIEMYEFITSYKDIHLISFDKLITSPYVVLEYISDICKYSFTKKELFEPDATPMFLPFSVDKPGYQDAIDIFDKSDISFKKCEELYNLTLDKCIIK